MAIFSTLRRFVIGGGLGNRLTAASTPPLTGPTSSSTPRLTQLLARVGIRHGSGAGAGRGAGAGGHGRKMVVKQSDFERRRAFDELHFQFVITTLPFVLLVLYNNIFVGQATLTEIPEGYEPKHWEYYKHPITRGWAKLMDHPEPMVHEMKMSKLYQLSLWQEKQQWEWKVEELMKDRQDYKAWYFLPYPVETTEKRYAKQRDDMRKFGSGPRGLTRITDDLG